MANLPTSIAAKLIVIVVLAFLAFSATARDLPQKLVFQHILEDQDIVLGEVRAIYQDSHGFIWIGGWRTLLRFDGYNFVEIFLEDGLETNKNRENITNVTNIIEDSTKNIWVTTSHAIFRYQTKTNKVERLPNNTEQAIDTNGTFFHSIGQLPSGKLLAAVSGIQNGVIIIDPSNFSYTAIPTNDEHKKEPSKPSYGVVNSVGISRQGTVWIGTETGLERYDPKKRIFTKVPVKPNTDIWVKDIAEDEKGNLWLASNNGVHLFNPKTRRHKHYTNECNNLNCLGSNDVWRITIDSKMRIWASTDQGGVNLYNEKKDHFVPFKHTPGDSTSLYSNVNRVVFEDDIGDLWLGFYPTGVDFFDQSSTAITSYRSNANDPNSLNHNSILAIEEDRQGNMWIGTDGGGLNFFNRQTRKFTHYTSQANDPTTIASNAVLCLLIDSENILWIGHWGGGLSSLNLKTMQIQRHSYYLPEDKKQPSSKINSPHIWRIYEDKNNTLWFATHNGGLNRYDRKTKIFQPFVPDPKNPNSINSDWIWSIFEDSKNRFWVGTINGISILDRNTGIFRRFTPENSTLTGHVIYDITETNDGQIWFATNSGANKFEEDKENFTNITRSDGLFNDNIRSIIPDQNNKLWLGTTGGVSTYDTKTEKVKNLNRDSGKLVGAFNFNASKLSSKGEIIMGGVNGLRIYQPDKLLGNTTVPPIVFTGLQVNTDKILPGDESNILDFNINATDTLTLDYTKSMFVITFSALNYRDSGKNQYRYKLEGFDDAWIDSGTSRSAKYTNLDAGTYTFRVQGSNNDGLWNTQGKSLTIIQLPPPWQTWWAYCIYIISFVSAIAYLFYIQHRKAVVAKERMEQERAVNIRLKEIDKLKDEFLANTSHELRTPIHGIVGLAESLVDGAAGPLSEPVRKHLQMITFSGKRLGNLVNDILDFSALKNKKLELDLKPINLRNLAEVILSLSQPLIGNKDLQLINDIPESQQAVMADIDRLQQILFNLIGNAIKFTEKGSVSILLTQNEDFSKIEIRDTGIGIPKDKLSAIFESFEQVKGSADRTHSGTGLGLSVTKKLVELHKSELKVESQVGIGSCFSFCLTTTDEVATVISLKDQAVQSRIFNEHLDTNQPTEASQINQQEKMSLSIIPNTSSNSFYKNEDIHILVVDDEPINRQVMINHLSTQNYQVSTACDGPEALEKFNSDTHYDLVLLDLMMPSMSGYEVCERLREKYPSQQLPIIFLTAKNLVADLVVGFNTGANDFISKPVAKEELFARIQVHLQLLDINRHLEHKVEERTKTIQEKHQHLKRTQSQLVQSESMARLVTLVAGMAHEFNNPLNFTKVGATNLEEEVEDMHEIFQDLISEDPDEEGKAFLEDVLKRFDSLYSSLRAMKDGANRIQSLINDLHAFSRLGQESKENSNLSKILEPCISLANARYGRDINISLEIIDDCILSAHVAPLNQAFMNIIENACQAINDKPNQVDTRTQNTLDILIDSDFDNAIIRFSDSGIGMNDEMLHHIFEPFFTGRPVGEGVGLGLSIAYSAIEKEEGSIQAESTPGIGTTITVKLPRINNIPSTILQSGNDTTRNSTQY